MAPASLADDTVSSLDPSFITITSGSGYKLLIFLIISPMVADSLYAGMIIEISDLFILLFLSFSLFYCLFQQSGNIPLQRPVYKICAIKHHINIPLSRDPN